MINYDSILSAFDGKPTLLQWLKLVKKALDENVLKDITLKQDGTSVIFTFNFEDGTSISTPAVTLPKGDTGAKGDKGEQGVSVTGVDEVSDEVVGNQTLTTLRFHFSNGTNDEVVVYAENGKNAGIGVIISQPASATSGTLTADQLATLQASDNNYIIFNNELYRLADKQHTAGILSYTHTGWDGTAVQNKSINITISTLAWALLQGESDGKLYMHKLQCSGDGATYYITAYSKAKEIFDDDYLKAHPNCLIGAISTKADANGNTSFDRVIGVVGAAGLPTNIITINALGITPPQLTLTLGVDTIYDLDEKFVG